MKKNTNILKHTNILSNLSIPIGISWGILRNYWETESSDERYDTRYEEEQKIDRAPGFF